MIVDLAVVNGTIYTMDPGQPTVTALAVTGGRVSALGTLEAVRPHIGPRTQVLDLAGHIAIPGLTDAHLHFASYGLSLAQVDLTGVRSAREAAERVRARAEATPVGEWVQGRGWDRNLWSPPGLPRREVLDELVSANPVALSSKDGHSLWLNSQALERLGATRGELDRWGAQVLRDERSGEPSGILVEEAAGDAGERIPGPGPEELRRAICLAAEQALRVGLTGVHDCEGGAEMAAFAGLWREQALPLRVYMLIPRENLDAAIQLGMHTGFGDEWLRIGHLKLFADGALGSHTADMLEPYQSEPTNRGVSVLDGDKLHTVVERASRARIAVATHAIGDRANRRVLNAYERTRPLWAPAGLRPRIEHVQLLAEADVPRLAGIGVIASMQPIHATSDYQMAETYWGPRSRGAYAWRSLLDAGTVLAFGSDCPVETMDPLAGIYAAVKRQRPDGTPPGGWRPEQCLSVEEAVRAYTWGAAYAAGEERDKGSLTPGKVGDLAILSHDIFRIPPEALLETHVLGTVCGGRLAYATP